MDTLAAKASIRFKKAVLALEKALALGELPEHAERDAALLRFELAAELTPKLLQRILSERGANVTLPKDAVRTAVSAELVGEQAGTMLLEIIDDRNRMVHDYSETFAQELFERIKSTYAPVLRALADTI